jgi:hypothetical protein
MPDSPSVPQVPGGPGPVTSTVDPALLPPGLHFVPIASSLDMMAPSQIYSVLNGYHAGRKVALARLPDLLNRK